MKTIILVDGNALMHRSYHGVNKGFIPVWKGMKIGMVYGFGSMLLHIIQHFRPDTIIVTFDTKEKTFRHEADANYKAQREKAPDDFYVQIPYIYELLESFEIPVLKLPGFESDDLIGTLAHNADKKEHDVKILSGDLDFLQLISENVSLVRFNGRIEQQIPYGPKETLARYGIEPKQMIDFKAIVGDSSDNFKGIVGIGPKTATNLLQEFGTLDKIYEHVEELAPKVRDKFIEQKDQALHCKMLATIKTDVPIEYDLDAKFELCPDKTLAFLEKMEFRSLVNRFHVLNRKLAQPQKIEQKKQSKKEPNEEQLSMF